MSTDAGIAGLEDAASDLTFVRTVDRTLVHRRSLFEVFLTDARRTGPDSFAAAAVLPAVHPHYTSHAGAAGLVLDPMLLLECCRQAETYAAHAFHGVEMGAAFILRRWSAEFPVSAVGPVPTELTLTAITGNTRLVGGKIRGQTYTFTLWLRGARIGQVTMDVAFTTREAYLAIRSGRRGSPPPSSSEAPIAATRRPVDPARVGRVNATDTLLLDLMEDSGTLTAVLRVPAENPSLFDHSQDHVPAMVLVEAARQLAGLATEEWGGSAAPETTMVAMESTFSAYTELDDEIVVKATRTPSPDRAAGAGDVSRVEVSFHQGGNETSRTQVTIAPIPALSLRRRSGVA